ncbi:MAG: phenylalanine--tRNA ligase subunit beta [Gemmatimonadales bacterium]|nr:MAG: phenylalanine--tRNA ligase subunit beta [Gemmatimonadales bacterium]
MNISYRWLQSLAPDLEGTPDALAERLTALGFPVEDIQRLSEGLDGIVVAKVTEVRPHPNADRLRVCQVDGGAGIVQVVCGAPNVEAGAWYPLAPVGATLPGGMQIRKAKLRGEVSEGMLCSEIELGLGRGKDGLMELRLDPADPSVQPGAPLVGTLGLDDVRLDVEVTSNRPDLLSHRGIARELAKGGDASLVEPPVPGGASQALEGGQAGEGAEGGLPAEAGPAAGGGEPGVAVRIEDLERCPRYLGLVIRGIRVGPSPAWLQARLRAVGARPINNVVDVTNYVLLETGQPLHAFDLARIGGGEIVVRRARDGETLRTLDGVERKLTPDMLAICDADTPLAVAGVMGGEASEVSAGTTDILLECALFAPGPIRATRKALGLSTDASYRFERGVDPDGLERALRRCADLVVATAGGTPEGPVLDAGAARSDRPRVPLRIPRIARLLGIPFDADQVRGLLTPLGFGVEQHDAEMLEVEVPGWRSWDVTREVDLIEEIARRHGYDRFPDALAPYRPGTVPDHPLFALEDGLRSFLSGRGLLEAQTPAFAPRGEGEVAVMNPVSAEEGWLRSALVPALLRRVEYNLARGNRDVRLFELGTVFRSSAEAGALPSERTHLALVLHGSRAPGHWTGDAGAVDAWELKGLTEAIGGLVPGDAAGGTAAHATANGHAVRPLAGGGSAPGFVAGEVFEVVDATGAVVGTGGRVDPARLDLPPWAGAVWGLEITLPVEPAPRPIPRVRSLPTHPGVERDLALLVPDPLPAAKVVALARSNGGSLLRGVEIFDVYMGKGVEPGMRSIAIRLRFRADGRSLTDTEVDGAMEQVTRALREEIGVRIRGG